ncbi:MAG: hypothetical protein WBD63_03350, partial [Phycisphaerae bacterium]
QNLASHRFISFVDHPMAPRLVLSRPRGGRKGNKYQVSGCIRQYRPPRVQGETRICPGGFAKNRRVTAGVVAFRQGRLRRAVKKVDFAAGEMQCPVGVQALARFEVGGLAGELDLPVAEGPEAVRPRRAGGCNRHAA